MIGENSSSVGDEKASAEDIQVYFWTTPRKAHERIVAFVRSQVHRRSSPQRSGVSILLCGRGMQAQRG